MGAIVYVYGELALDIEESRYDKFKEAAEKIENAWGYQAFEVDNGDITFKCDQHEGSDPLIDGVDKPLEELLEMANKMGATLNGSFEISSDYGDLDNTTIIIDDNVSRWKNTELVNATTQDLLGELKDRGDISEKLSMLYEILDSIQEDERVQDNEEMMHDIGEAMGYVDNARDDYEEMLKKEEIGRE